MKKGYIIIVIFVSLFFFGVAYYLSAITENSVIAFGYPFILLGIAFFQRKHDKPLSQGLMISFWIIVATFLLVFWVISKLH